MELPGNEPAEYNYAEEPDRVDEDSEESSEETETYPCTESDADGCED